MSTSTSTATFESLAEVSAAARDRAIASLSAQADSTRVAARSSTPSRRGADFSRTAEAATAERERQLLLELLLAADSTDSESAFMSGLRESYREKEATSFDSESQSVDQRGLALPFEVVVPALAGRVAA